MPPHHHIIIAQQSHHNMPPYLYPSIIPYSFFLCPYFTSAHIYAPYAVPHYTHIPSLVYLHKSSIRLKSSVLPPHFSKNASEHMGKRINRISYEHTNKTRDVMSRREGEK